MNHTYSSIGEENAEPMQDVEIVESIICTPQPLDSEEYQVKIEVMDEGFAGEEEEEESLEINENETVDESFEGEEEEFMEINDYNYHTSEDDQNYLKNVEDKKQATSKKDLTRSFAENMRKAEDIKKYSFRKSLPISLCSNEKWRENNNNDTSKNILLNSHENNEQKLRNIKKHPFQSLIDPRKSFLKSKQKSEGSKELSFKKNFTFTKNVEEKMKSESLNDDTKVAKTLSARFKCPLCETDFDSRDELKEHIPIHSKSNFVEQSLQSKETLITCSECNFTTYKETALKYHKLKHTKPKLVCPDCGYECYPKSRLNAHMLLHNNVKSFKCSHCPYETNLERKLAIHMIRHTSSKIFKCSKCDYETYYEDRLKPHMLKHNREKQFKCSECNYECNFKSCLKLHMEKHTGEQEEKLFKCFACSFQCMKKETLKAHKLAAHTKLYKCSECSFITKYKKNLNIHLFTHAEESFKCPECNYKCSDKSFLKQHMLSHIILYDPTKKQWLDYGEMYEDS